MPTRRQPTDGGDISAEEQRLSDLMDLYWTTAYDRHWSSPLMLANLQGGYPSPNGIMTLPGSTPEQKIGYLLDYFGEGAKMGLSAADMLAHDTLLRKARPVSGPGGTRITDPRLAAQKSFRGVGGTLKLIQGNLDRDAAAGIPFDQNPRYRNFWNRYGMP